ncbi:OLC1v1013892C1 [Oldenlandia corymbosa var. corymbosa]|uniref:OLC1v1013892C1 n=1 Tax=Oldenlandia corymbosa var. corymbosa TaxID=529605 RepID=A0AAV1DZL3_OLDCO|nr:OLC1v1013892C1 [Oldenlandia corymbosa var. corymbosa]
MALAEELKAIIGRLSLWENESVRHSTISLITTPIDPFLTIIGKLYCPRIVSHDAIANHCRNIWSVRHGFTVQPVGENTVHIKFNDQIDRARVLHGESWLLGRKHLFVLKPHDDLNADFNMCPWWIQLHHRPIDANRNCIGRFLRIKVNMNITKPLTHVLQFDHEGKQLTIPLCYERLAEWCYHCGIIGHIETNCPTKPTHVGSSSLPPEYGPWLKATGYLNPFVSRRSAQEPDPFHVPDDSDEEAPPFHECQAHDLPCPPKLALLSINQSNTTISHPSDIPPLQLTKVNPKTLPHSENLTNTISPDYPAPPTKISQLSALPSNSSISTASISSQLPNTISENVYASSNPSPSDTTNLQPHTSDLDTPPLSPP